MKKLASVLEKRWKTGLTNDDLARILKDTDEMPWRGLYDPKTNSIFLATDATEATELEELLHFRQAVQRRVVGRTWKDALADVAEVESEVAKWLSRYGYALKHD